MVSMGTSSVDSEPRTPLTQEIKVASKISRLFVARPGAYRRRNTRYEEAP